MPPPPAADPALPPLCPLAAAGPPPSVLPPVPPAAPRSWPPAGRSSRPRPGRPCRRLSGPASRLPAALPVAALAAAALAGCTPALDWREVRPPDSAVQLLMPCRPQEHVRRIELAGAPVRMTLVACSAAAQTWALAWADVGDPARVGPALRALHAAAHGNLGLTADAAGAAAPAAAPPEGTGGTGAASGTSGSASAPAVPGATPNPDARRWRIDGRRPDGQPVQQEAVVFAWGTRVVQATVLGPQVPAAGAQTFLGSLRVQP